MLLIEGVFVRVLVVHVIVRPKVYTSLRQSMHMVHYRGRYKQN